MKKLISFFLIFLLLCGCSVEIVLEPEETVPPTITGDGELTYREYMIDTDMRTEALDTWTEELLESTALTEVNIGCLNRDLVVIPQS